MLKKFLMISAMCLVPVHGFAGAFYIGPGIVFENNTAEGGHYVGVSPRAALGYGTVLKNNLYLGGEVNMTLGALSISDSSDPSVKIDRSFAAGVLPGLMFTDGTLGYLRLSVVSSHFDGPNKNTTGGQIGLGLQTRLIHTWDIRAEYAYSAYPSIGNLHSPRSNSLMLSFIRKFC